eukprot:TRINITY_DN11795_c0_g1_i2.p1 TRINITY_DN11795_c0_g1~~TRINITY_DN11795_c0_g1_i2.p1  ORF type:complete len:1567 (+),score=451.44 TRINITY_DN11795_c0_g1_i2:90-4790(+)
MQRTPTSTLNETLKLNDPAMGVVRQCRSLRLLLSNHGGRSKEQDVGERAIALAVTEEVAAALELNISAIQVLAVSTAGQQHTQVDLLLRGALNGQETVAAAKLAAFIANARKSGWAKQNLRQLGRQAPARPLLYDAEVQLVVEEKTLTSPRHAPATPALMNRTSPEPRWPSWMNGAALDAGSRFGTPARVDATPQTGTGGRTQMPWKDAANIVTERELQQARGLTSPVSARAAAAQPFNGRQQMAPDRSPDLTAPVNAEAQRLLGMAEELARTPRRREDLHWKTASALRQQRQRRVEAAKTIQRLYHRRFETKRVNEGLLRALEEAERVAREQQYFAQRQRAATSVQAAWRGSLTRQETIPTMVSAREMKRKATDETLIQRKLREEATNQQDAEEAASKAATQALSRRAREEEAKRKEEEEYQRILEREAELIRLKADLEERRRRRLAEEEAKRRGEEEAKRKEEEEYQRILEREAELIRLKADLEERRRRRLAEEEAKRRGEEEAVVRQAHLEEARRQEEEAELDEQAKAAVAKRLEELDRQDLEDERPWTDADQAGLEEEQDQAAHRRARREADKRAQGRESRERAAEETASKKRAQAVEDAERSNVYAEMRRKEWAEEDNEAVATSPEPEPASTSWFSWGTPAKEEESQSPEPARAGEISQLDPAKEPPVRKVRSNRSDRRPPRQKVSESQDNRLASRTPEAEDDDGVSGSEQSSVGYRGDKSFATQVGTEKMQPTSSATEATSPDPAPESTSWFSWGTPAKEDSQSPPAPASGDEAPSKPVAAASQPVRKVQSNRVPPPQPPSEGSQDDDARTAEIPVKTPSTGRDGDAATSSPSKAAAEERTPTTPEEKPSDPLAAWMTALKSAKSSPDASPRGQQAAADVSAPSPAQPSPQESADPLAAWMTAIASAQASPATSPRAPSPQEVQNATTSQPQTKPAADPLDAWMANLEGAQKTPPGAVSKPGKATEAAALRDDCTQDVSKASTRAKETSAAQGRKASDPLGAWMSNLGGQQPANSSSSAKEEAPGQQAAANKGTADASRRDSSNAASQRRSQDGPKRGSYYAQLRERKSSAAKTAPEKSAATDAGKRGSQHVVRQRSSAEKRASKEGTKPTELRVSRGSSNAGRVSSVSAVTASEDWQDDGAPETPMTKTDVVNMLSALEEDEEDVDAAEDGGQRREGFDADLVAPHIQVKNSGVYARHTQKAEGAEFGVVFGTTELRRFAEGWYFEVTLEERLSGEQDGLVVGVTTADPSTLTDNQLDDMMVADAVPDSWSFGYDGRAKKMGSEEMLEINWQPSELNPGNSVGLLVTPNGDVIIYQNAVQVAQESFGLPVGGYLSSAKPFFPFIDLLGSAVAATYVVGAEPPRPPQECGFDTKVVGSRVAISEDERFARKLPPENQEDEEEEDLFGFVFSKVPLQVFEDAVYLEVRIEEVQDGCNDGLVIGVTTENPRTLPADQILAAADVPKSWTFGYDGQMLIEGSDGLIEIPWQPQNLQEDDRVGLMVAGGEAVIFQNRQEVFAEKLDIPADVPLYGILDLLGNTVAVSLVPGASPPEEEPLPEDG